MDLLNKAKSSFAMAGKELTQKANDVSGMARVNMKIKEEEKKLHDAIYQLGLQMIDMQPDEAARLFPELAYSIHTMRTDIDKDRRELAGYKGMRLCPNCGAEQDQNAICCTACGVNMDDAEQIIESEEKKIVFCKNCGKPFAADGKFCTNCGTPKD